MDTRTKENIVDARIKKVLGTRTDTVTMLESLDAISEFFGKNGNTMEARRALRQDLEFQNIRLAKMYLSEFETLRDCIVAVDEGSIKMENECREMAKRVSKADENMKMFMQKASLLEERRNSYIQQSADIDKFLVQYQLTPEEVNCIHYAPINISNTEVFFSALKRLKLAYNDCKHMADVHQYSAGFEMLEILGNHQDVGYQRLFEWVKKKCDDEDEDDSDFNDHDDVALQMAVKYLREVPVYFTQCQDLIICSRRSLLVHRFIVALTQGGSGGHMSSRAIEMHSHDSIRYVGDMLSWMHQTIASEKEFLVSIFGSAMDNRGCDKIDVTTTSEIEEDFINESKKENEVEDEDDDDADADNDPDKLAILSIPEILASCLEGLGRPLRVRIMQALQNCGQNIETLYTIGDLLCFYKNTISASLQLTENSVYLAVHECLEECKAAFSAALDAHSDALVKTTLSSLTVDLMSSNATKESSRMIHDILKVHMSAMSELSSSSDVEGEACFINNVLGCSIHPILQACRTCGNNVLQQGSDMAIFMLNNVSTIKAVLTEASNQSAAGKEATSSWIDLLDTEIVTWESVLVTESTNRFLQRSEMDRLVDLIEVLPAGLVASEQPGLSQDQLSACLRSFYASLFSVSTPLIERLQDLELREMVRVKTSMKISEAYSTVHNMVLIESNAYHTENMLTHSIQEVQVLLGFSASQ